VRDQDSEGSGDYGGAYGIRKRAKEVNHEVLEWLGHDDARPFFACLNYLDVHFPYGVPSGYPKPAWDSGSDIDQYDAGLEYEDDFIGHLLSALAQRGLGNTLVVLTSDHGESLGDHGLSYHGASLYRELVHVPLIIGWPGHVPAGKRISVPVSNAEIPATIMSLIGHPDRAFPGPNLELLWKAPELAAQWPYPLAQLAQTDTIVAKDRAMQSKIPLATDGDMASVVTPQWQLIVHTKHGPQVYDWAKDLQEANDVSPTGEGQAQLRNLMPLLSSSSSPQRFLK
jgi:arylsulfatase A-like enzyme